jgi:DNA polymerase-1
MQLNGIGIDAASHRTLMRMWRKNRKAAVAALAEMGGPENLNSCQQVAAFFEAHAKKARLASWPRTKGGQLSTAADNLAAYADIPAVTAYLEYCKWNDRLKSHGESLAKFVHPETGRLHPGFMIAAALTGRMSASRPNVQGLPREPEFRALFVPEPGHVFVRADYNQMQLRIAGLLSGDATLLAAFESEHDVHRLTAARVLGKKVEELDEGDRGKAKAIGFGILFGMGPKGLQSYARSSYGVAMSEDEAGRIRERFLEAYPDLQRWQQEQVRKAQQTGCSTTPMGRVRNFTREDREQTYTVSMNTPVQGAEAEVMLAALGRLPKALEPLDAHPVNVIHDEILCECPAEKADEVAVALRGCMEDAMRDVFPSASLTKLIDIGIGPNWADAK